MGVVRDVASSRAHSMHVQLYSGFIEASMSLEYKFPELHKSSSKNLLTKLEAQYIMWM